MLMQGDNLKLFLLGNVIAFIVAVIAIKFFIGVIKKYGFKPWGWYRIIAGIALLVYFRCKYPDMPIINFIFFKQ